MPNVPRVIWKETFKKMADRLSFIFLSTFKLDSQNSLSRDSIMRRFTKPRIQTFTKGSNNFFCT